MKPQQKTPHLSRNTLFSKRPHKSSFQKSLPSHLYERARNELLLRNPNYILYLFSLLRRSQLYHLWNGYLVVFRKFRLVSLLLRLYSYLLLLVQFGTAFFVIALALLLLIPTALIGAVCVIFSALLLYGRKNRHMEQKLSGKDILVFFPSRDGEFQNGQFWRKNIDDLACKTDKPNTILVVSPFFWSFRGVFGRSPYVLVREEKPNVYLLRKHYYFSLGKKVLLKNKNSLTLIF